MANCQVGLGAVVFEVLIPFVVLANFDLIDKLGVGVLPSIPVEHLLSALLAALFASFRSRAAVARKNSGQAEAAVP